MNSVRKPMREYVRMMAPTSRAIMASNRMRTTRLRELRISATLKGRTRLSINARSFGFVVSGAS